MRFSWDSANLAHITLHGVTSEEAEQVIENDPLDLERQIENHEERFVHLGETNSGRVLFVIVTIREDALRVVTAFPADKPTRSIILMRKRNTMAKTLETPKFKSEEEEANWWAANQKLLHNEFQQAAKDGTTGRGTLARRGATPTTTIRLDPTDVELAKVQAEKRGLRYQTYLKLIIHQALTQESSQSR